MSKSFKFDVAIYEPRNFLTVARHRPPLIRPTFFKETYKKSHSIRLVATPFGIMGISWPQFEDVKTVPFVCVCVCINFRHLDVWKETDVPLSSLYDPLPLGKASRSKTAQ